MASNFNKAEKYVKQGDEYKLLSYATSSESVQMTDGTDLQEKIENIETKMNELDATPDNIVLYADDGEVVEVPDVDNGTSSNYELPVATAETLGGVKQGANVTIATDGTISVDKVTVDSELSETSTNPVQNKAITTKLEEVFQSVSNGKSLIASAITDKGVTTDADTTFEAMAENISNILIVPDTYIYHMTLRNGIIQPYLTSFAYFVALTPFKPGEQTWEIGIKIYLYQYQNRNHALFGDKLYFTKSPSLEVNTDGSLWAGVTHVGTGWEMQANSGSKKLNINTWYYVKMSYDGTYYYVDVSTDGKQWDRYITIQSTGSTMSTDEMQFNTIASSSDHNSFYVRYDMRNVYFKINNALIWGNAEV